MLTKFPNNTALRMFPVFEQNLHESHVKSQFVPHSKNTRRFGYET